MNENLAKAFDAMAREYKKDRFRKRAYENAAAAIRNYEGKIVSGKQARNEIKGIGESIAAKIDEILASGTLKRLEAISQESKDKDKILKIFENVYGVGTTIAEKWYDEGYRSLEDLKKKLPEMTPAQQLGYTYYHDLQKKIPRSELDMINDLLHKYWDKYKVSFVIGGSYRRGEPESSDIDVIVRDGIEMDTLLHPLRKNGHLIGSLTKQTGKTWYGLVNFTGTVRRMDILLVDKKEFPYTLIYFTGDLRFNVELRTLASKRGYKLTGHELTNVKGENIYLPTEKAIFDFFNLKYLEPTQRKGNFVLEEKEKEEVKEGEVKEIKFISGWLRPSEDLFIYVHPEISSGGHVAAFDLDGTLTRPKVGEFPRAVDDVVLMPKRREVLLDYIGKGYTIVIFTNQKSRGEKDKINKYNRVINATKLLDVPLLLFMSTGDDQYRKPNIGMWETMLQMIFPIKSSFYVGNSAGRPQDHSNADILFAKNVGTKFYTPEEFFGI